MSPSIVTATLLRASDVEARLRALADPTRAAATQRYFKSGAGQYGEGDRFLGITAPRIRALMKEFRELPLPEFETLLESDWHEVRALAVMLLASRFGPSDARTQAEIYRLYLRCTDRVNNWDLVDVSAPAIVGGHLLHRSRAPLRRLARSRSLWERRIAIVATQTFIRNNDFADTLAISRMLFADGEDLIHKATGWMLREVGKRNERVLTRFLDSSAADMPRTALRYAIERLSPAQRKKYMAVTPRRLTARRAAPGR